MDNVPKDPQKLDVLKPKGGLKTVAILSLEILPGAISVEASESLEPGSTFFHERLSADGTMLRILYHVQESVCVAPDRWRVRADLELLSSG